MCVYVLSTRHLEQGRDPEKLAERPAAHRGLEQDDPHPPGGAAVRDSHPFAV